MQHLANYPLQFAQGQQKDDFFLSNFLASPPSTASYSPPDYNSDPSTGSGYQSPPSSLDFDLPTAQLPITAVDYLRKQQLQAMQANLNGMLHPSSYIDHNPPISQQMPLTPTESAFATQPWMPSLYEQPRMPSGGMPMQAPRPVPHYEGMPWSGSPTYSNFVDVKPAEVKRRKITKPVESSYVDNVQAGFVPQMFNNSPIQAVSTESSSPLNLALMQGVPVAAAASVESAPTKNSKRRFSETREEPDDDENGPSGHNAVEKRYRTKINSSLTTLQSLIPALAHLRESDTPAQTTSTRRASAFILTTPSNVALPAGTKIDGVEAPNKLSKGIIIDKGIEYIRVLKKSRAELEQQLQIAESLLDQFPQLRAQYDHMISTASPPAPAEPTRRQAAPKRSMYGVIAGVGILGTTGYGLHSTNLSTTAQSAGSSAWTGATEFVKRGLESPPPVASSYSLIPTVAIFAWLAVLAWYVGCAMGTFYRSGQFSLPSASSKKQAMETLAAFEKSAATSRDEAEIDQREVIAARQALLTLSGLTRLTSIGTLTGIAREGILSYLSSLGWRILYPTAHLPDNELVERACALVRLAEIESAYKSLLCSRFARLYTCLRLHNLVRSSHWPSEEVSPPQLSRARVDATLALALVSVFSSQASGMSRRRRFWRTAIAEPKRSEAPMEPWVQVALGAEYEEACSAAFMPLGLPSPSDSIPLLRISEARCTSALRAIWSRIFIAMMHSFVATYGQSLGVDCEWSSAVATDTENSQLGVQLDNIVKSTVVGSPVHYMAMLTRGFWAMGVGQMAAARQVGSYLALDAFQAGPSAHLVAVREYCRVILPLSDAELPRTESDSLPRSDLDAIALTALKWLEIRRCVLSKGFTKIDESLHALTLEARRCLNFAVWNDDKLEQSPDSITAQQVSVQLAEQLGRRALGLDQLETDPVEG